MERTAQAEFLGHIVHALELSFFLPRRSRTVNVSASSSWFGVHPMPRFWLRFGTIALLVLSCGWLVAVQPPAQPKTDDTQADDEALRKANIAPDDGPALNHEQRLGNAKSNLGQILLKIVFNDAMNDDVRVVLRNSSLHRQQRLVRE